MKPRYKFEDYIITKDGEVISPSGKKLTSRPTKRGYLRVQINKKDYYIHRLVAEKYLPNEENKPQIDHINGDKSDNRVENLRWVTPQENMNNPLTKQKISEITTTYFQTNGGRSKDSIEKQKKTISSKNNYIIIQINNNNEIIATYNSITNAANTTKLCASDIGRTCNGKRYSCGGYKWIKKFF